MVDYREILRLHSLGKSQRTIAECTGNARSTVQEVLNLAKAKRITWPLDKEATNTDLEILLYPNRAFRNENRLEPDFPKIHRELARKGVTLTLLWLEYCDEARAAGKQPYMSTQFNELYRKWAVVNKATMRIQRKPGDTLEVDWAGSTINIYDSATGEPTEAYLFVGVLSCSGLVYAEVCSNMRAENFVLCHVHAYEYFGGVTRLLVPDNLKAGVTKNTRYETVIPRAYREMADYYDTAIQPTRIKAPDDKPNAEGSVRFATTWILAALRNQHFFSLQEAKDAVKEKLEELNNKPFQKRPGSRRSAYEEEERAYMKPLPAVRFEFANWSSAKVANDYCISDGRNRYSVPFDLIGERVEIRTTKDTVEVFFHGGRVASHVRREKAQRDAIVSLDHMPEKHRKYLSYNKASFLEWAETVGQSTTLVIRSFLESGKEPEQGYKYCVSLMNAVDRYSRERVEAACVRVLALSSSPSLRNIMAVLKNGQDKIPLSESSAPKSTGKGIVRGAEAFRKGGVRRD